MPGIVHLGLGSFHRSHQAVYLDELFRSGHDLDWAVVGVGTTAADAPLHEALVAQDLCWTVETRLTDGRSEHRVVGTLVEHLLAHRAAPVVLERLSAPGTRWVTLTVTEGGYPVAPGSTSFSPTDALLADLDRDVPVTAVGLLTRALARRRDSGAGPVAVVSCDNLQGNGAVARASVLGAAEHLGGGLADWVAEHVDFPGSMVDRITPATTPSDRRRVAAATGWSDGCPVLAEPYREWVLEEPVGPRPALERVGVRLVPDVAPFEGLKLRVLNGGHQALAWAGLLRGHAAVHDAASDPLVRGFVDHFLRTEVVPTLDPVPGVDPEAYVDVVLQRFAHPHLPDTTARLAAHSGDRVPGFVLVAAGESAARGRHVPCTAALVALWVEAVRRDRVGGAGARVVVDPPASVVRGLDAVLRDRELLGALVDDERFVRQVDHAAFVLRDYGVAALLETSAARRAPAVP